MATGLPSVGLRRLRGAAAPPPSSPDALETGLGFRVYGPELRVQGLGFRVQGSRLRDVCSLVRW